ncbi:MAG: hypothetical protein GWN62_08885, partial [Aliifodinibius sp.]|nr:hypothetical protein [Fodinibius sp.]
MLDILHVTQSYTPDIQWLGGRVAAIGVNRGTNAAMDSSLLWLMTSDDNNINSYVTVGMETNVNRIMEVGGIPEDSLDDEQIYTFWVAEKSIYDANLDTLQRNGFNFADTTVEIKFGLKG